MARSNLIPLAYELVLKASQTPWRRQTYHKILVPLDGSPQAEKVVGMVQPLLSPGGKLILLQVVPTGKSQESGEDLMLADRLAEARCAGARGYLQGVVSYLAPAPGRCRCEVITSDSVSQGVVAFAEREEVDLIAMYDHERKGLAKLIQPSVAREVQQGTSILVRVMRPRDLVAV
ncbi:MAG: universal stress protein [Dehalococcoidia bacterium]